MLIGCLIGIAIFAILWLTRDYTLKYLIIGIGSIFGMSSSLEGEARTSATLSTIVYGVFPLCLMTGVLLVYGAAALRSSRSQL